MARISYTSYRFDRPPLIKENDYVVLKYKLESDSDFYPFKGEGFYQKYKIVILFYVIGLPIAALFGYSKVGVLEVIGGGYAILSFVALFSFVPEWLSYLSYLAERRLYFKKLMRKIKKSSDYSDFVKLMR